MSDKQQFHYLFTNDLRITRLDVALKNAGESFISDTVPTADVDKNENNNMNTLGFYFNFTKTSNCARAASKGKIHKVVFNFIKKFQFPNTRTEKSFNDARTDGILLAPMRTILKVLYMMRFIDLQKAFLSRKEIVDFIFFNEKVAKKSNPDIFALIQEIWNKRDGRFNDDIPTDDILESNNFYWTQCNRQIREMVKVLSWSGCVSERNDGTIEIFHNNLTDNDKADLFEILNYTDFWEPEDNKTFTEQKTSYQKYMDIADDYDAVILPKTDYRYDVDGLAAELKREYDEAGGGKEITKSTSIHLFGIKYGQYIDSKNFSAKNIIVKSGINQTLDTELKKGIKLSYFVGFLEKPFTLPEAEELLQEDAEYSKAEQNKILYGPPGTGKTYKLNEDYKDFYDKDEEKNGLFFVTFHQSFSYEEFVEGIKAEVNKDNHVEYNVKPGIFYKACNRAAELIGYENDKNAEGETVKTALEKYIEDENRFGKTFTEDKKVVVCIDEINRGNIAAIFGELISLIEPEKRLGCNSEEELIVTLPYSKKKFSVPPNLSIVGTMNTADRSIQVLDTALRRRFVFEELLPKYDVIENENAKKVLEKINDRIRAVLGKDYQIGHSYFMKCSSDSDIFNVLKNKVIPLLEEYFYNDIQKIKFVLNDEKDNKFYVKDEKAQNNYKSFADGKDEKEFYKFNDELKESGAEDCINIITRDN